MAVPGTSIAGHVQSVLDGDIEDYRNMAPEIHSPEEHDTGATDKIIVTKEGDVYGMGMVAYEASSYGIILPEGQILR